MAGRVAAATLLSLLILLRTGDARGLNFEPCCSDQDCQNDRKCLQYLDLTNIVIPNDVKCSADDDYCICIGTSPTTFDCDEDSDCDSGEECLNFVTGCVGKEQRDLVADPHFCKVGDGSNCNAGLSCIGLPSVEEENGPTLDGQCLAPRPRNNCRSTGGSNNGDDGNAGDLGDGGGDEESGGGDGGEGEEQESGGASSENVCVAVHHLGQLSGHELVYKKHRLAQVLCDARSNCATPGHMVRYKGEAMMMSSYCQIAQCEKRVMKVNSPRYRVGLEIESRSSALRFTAFAARYGTRFEETVLKTVMRVGM